MMTNSQIYQHILIGFAVVLLFCAIKSYLAFLVIDTAWCNYLCPSAFGFNLAFDAPELEQLFMMQRQLLSSLQMFVKNYINDPWNLVTYLIIAPVIEEVIYRGPMYLTRHKSNRLIWWFIGITLVCMFALSHGRSGVALLPVITLGTYNLWLVRKTDYLWPSISLHFLYNFFFFSAMLYQSPWISN